jgi:TPR repeat protein
MCEAARAAFNRKMDEWFYAQSNNVEIMEREADPTAVDRAYELLQANPVESFTQYLALAERGSVWSMATVGQMLYQGTGTAQDLEQAEQWLLRAYHAGSDYGLICLGYLYERSKRYEEAQEVYKTGAARGFVPAILYLAACYRRSPNWAQDRRKTLALLEQGPAASDLFVRHWLTNAMVRGWFGLRYIPEGIRRLPGVAHEMAVYVEYGTEQLQGDSKKQQGFFSHLAAQVWLVGATDTERHSTERHNKALRSAVS